MSKKLVFKNKEELAGHIKTHGPSFYFSSQTSTVIPYDKLEQHLGLKDGEEFYLCDLSQMPAKMELLDNGNLQVQGAVSWKDAREFLKSKGRNIKTAPTEELALITAGLATSATGERCFAFGNLRSQVVRLKYFDYQGEEKELFRDKPLEIDGINFDQYREEFKAYSEFKNAPFPRFQNETDLLIGTEGQLGIITEVEIETTPNTGAQHLFMLLPKWEQDYSAHLEVIEKIQKFRDEVVVVELIDSNAFSFLPEDERPNQGKDAIFFEIKTEAFEKFYEEFLATLEGVNEEEIFELTETRFHNIRASVPRAVFEENSRMGVVKMGTDVQVRVQDFKALMDIYREFSKVGVRYNLFGHFGDAHLHFNFMPAPDDIELCKKRFEHLYEQVLKMKGSPFAEHGIGLIKQKYIQSFIGPVQKETFKALKDKLDPHRQFFPQGYMH
ncbi:MAG: FAD-binding oxidoreductase [Bacteriovoracaceae bacterium]|nr:FAD-binding oxidoreductase [Bacteriovoracaceae bacterium]